ncbi:MAG: Asp-tRNA(Asn)/Glu-tRNA(Gln) amidotransferase subunit GatA, partial [Clostridia bacterium]|nr:Asp-tRNA(Asn)/Glu-tRNA(Gln) amidotransferase subunit GatA [Clostridia bacterium]
MIKKSVYEHYKALKNKEYSSLELTNEYLKEIEKNDGELGAYITVTSDIARSAAEEFDKGKCRKTILSGIPMNIKDNICTKGVKTTCGSRMLEDFIPPYDAFVVEKLKSEGAVLLGKTNMDEFAMGSTCENSAFKITKNPVDSSRVPGGSSGGGAAAVAKNEAAYALGSETGGSVRQPASFCGLVGMKPTYGSVSRYGLVAYASSLDQIGPITKTVVDNAIVMNAIVGHDKLDSTSVLRKYDDFTVGIKKGVKGLKIGLPKEFFDGAISDDVKSAVMNAAKEYEKMGAELIDVSFPSLNLAPSTYYTITCAEASSNLARYDGIRFGHRAEKYNSIDELYKKSRGEGFGQEVKKRIMAGTMVLSAGYHNEYYKKALTIKSKITGDFKRSFGKCQIILAPVSPTVAYKIGGEKEPLRDYLGDIYTVSVNLAGVPAISIPCGTGEYGMPVGMQLIGPHFSESLLYRAAFAYENMGKA